MQNILYIQKFIYRYKDNYVINHNDLNKLFKLNTLKVIKNNSILKRYYFKYKNIYLLTKEGIILLTMIINSYYLIEITEQILETFNILENINKDNINKIKQIENLFVC